MNIFNRERETLDERVQRLHRKVWDKEDYGIEVALQRKVDMMVRPEIAISIFDLDRLVQGRFGKFSQLDNEDPGFGVDRR